MATAHLRAVLEGFDQAKRELSSVGKLQDDINNKKPDWSATNEGTKAIKELGNAANDTSGKMVSMTTVATAAGVAVAALTVKIGEEISKTIELGDRMNELRQLTGRTTEELSGLSLAFETNGLSLERGAKGLERFNKYLFEAQNGNKQAARTFQAMGIDVKQFGDDAEGALEAVADKVSKMRDGHEKTALVMRIFRDPQYIAFLNEGSEGLKKLREEAEQAGIIMGTKTAKAADEFNDAMAVMNAHVRGFWQDLSTPFVLAMGEIAKGMRDAKRDGEGFFGMLLQGARDTARIGLFGSEEGQLGNAKARLAEVRKNIGRAMATGDVGLLRSSEAEEASLVGDVRRLTAFTAPTLTGDHRGAAPDLPDRGGRTAGGLDAATKLHLDRLALFENAQRKAEEQAERDWKAEIKREQDAVKLALEGIGRVEQAEADAEKRGTAELKRNQKERADSAEQEIKDVNNVIYLYREGKAKALDELAAKYKEMGLEGAEALKKVTAAQADNRREQSRTLSAVFELKSAFGQLGFDTLAIFGGMSRSIQKNLAEVLKGHQSIGQGIRGVWKGIADSAIDELARIGTNSLMGAIGLGGGRGGVGGSGVGLNFDLSSLGSSSYLQQRWADVGNTFGNIGAVTEAGGSYGLWEAAGDFFGGFFATGTDSVITKPTMVMVGENGPERLSVTPLAGGSGYENQQFRQLFDNTQDTLREVIVAVSQAANEAMGAIAMASAQSAQAVNQAAQSSVAAFGGLGKGAQGVVATLGGMLAGTFGSVVGGPVAGLAANLAAKAAINEMFSDAALNGTATLGELSGFHVSFGDDHMGGWGESMGVDESMSAEDADLGGGFDDGGAWATGGERVVTRPTRITVGERGPEKFRVTPLAGATSRSSGPTVVFQGPVIMDEYSTRLWMRGQARQMRSL